MTPLMAAAIRGYPQIAAVLLDHGARSVRVTTMSRRR